MRGLATELSDDPLSAINAHSMLKGIVDGKKIDSVICFTQALALCRPSPRTGEWVETFIDWIKTLSPTISDIVKALDASLPKGKRSMF